MLDETGYAGYARERLNISRCTDKEWNKDIFDIRGGETESRAKSLNTAISD